MPAIGGVPAAGPDQAGPAVAIAVAALLTPLTVPSVGIADLFSASS